MNSTGTRPVTLERGDETRKPPSKEGALAVRKVKAMRGGGVEMTFALHGKRVQKRPRLTADQKASIAMTRQMGVCLPCKLDRKKV